MVARYRPFDGSVIRNIRKAMAEEFRGRKTGGKNKIADPVRANIRAAGRLGGKKEPEPGEPQLCAGFRTMKSFAGFLEGAGNRCRSRGKTRRGRAVLRTTVGPFYRTVTCADVAKCSAQVVPLARPALLRYHSRSS